VFRMLQTVASRDRILYQNPGHVFMNPDTQQEPGVVPSPGPCPTSQASAL
jgi:hypothetical protein